MVHLTSFIVENFKRFERFEMDNIGQYNLLFGDNNVGKTSVLEALLFHPEPHVFKHRLLTVLFTFRNFDDITRSYWFYFANRKKLPNLEGAVTFTTQYIDAKRTIDKIAFTEKKENTVWQRIIPESDYSTYLPTDLVNEENLEYFRDNRFVPRFDGTFSHDGTLKLDGSFIPHPTMPYIPFFLGYEHNLTRKFTKYIQRSESLTAILIQNLQCMIPGAKGIIVETEETSPRNPILLVRQEGNDIAMPLGTFGDGAIKLFRILVEIIVHKDERLMIDEIDSGVHVSHFHDFWRAILNAAAKSKVQLFATTHNLECLEFFKDVLEEEDMKSLQKNARGINLVADRVGETRALTYTFEQFQYAMNNNIDPRAVFRI
jgi:AAA15 family ATPase/GTPase